MFSVTRSISLAKDCTSTASLDNARCNPNMEKIVDSHLVRRRLKVCRSFQHSSNETTDLPVGIRIKLSQMPVLLDFEAENQTLQVQWYGLKDTCRQKREVIAQCSRVQQTFQRGFETPTARASECESLKKTTYWACMTKAHSRGN